VCENWSHHRQHTVPQTSVVFEFQIQSLFPASLLSSASHACNTRDSKAVWFGPKLPAATFCPTFCSVRAFAQFDPGLE
jgi:hypothetical protein